MKHNTGQQTRPENNHHGTKRDRKLVGQMERFAGPQDLTWQRALAMTEFAIHFGIGSVSHESFLRPDLYKGSMWGRPFLHEMSGLGMEELGRDQTISLKVLGFLYLRLGFSDRAARLFRALLALSPEDAEVTQSLAAALLENGNAEEALRLLETSPLRADLPNPVPLLLKAQALWRLQRNEEAFAAMNAYLAAAGEAR
jgi:predicted Zn-dependent protease